MVCWLRPVLLLFLATLAFGSCGSCTSCGCRKEEASQAPRLFPSPQSGFALGTPRPGVPEVKRQSVEVPTIEATEPSQLPSPVSEVPLPEDFPQDVPLFEGSQPFAVQSLAGNAKNVLFHVDAERSQVFQHYREQMQRQGWKLTQEYDARYQSFLAFKKDDMIAQMTISTDPRTEKRVVAIMYQKEEPLPFEEF